MEGPRLDVPDAWKRLSLQGVRGVVMVIGGPDAGKSTLARYLVGRLRAGHERVALLDGDPGQSSLGPPTTMTLRLYAGGEGQGRRWRAFVGSVSPTGHMLPLVVGAARLVQAARRAGAEAVVYDTTGLIHPSQGGLALKFAKINLLRPALVLAIQRQVELEPILMPLRRTGRVRLVELRPSEAVRPRDLTARQTHRARQFARYFERAQPLEVRWGSLAVFPSPWFALHRLLAFEDREGFVRGLGIVLDIDRAEQRLTVLTPLKDLTSVDSLHLGDLLVDPETFRDRRLPRAT